MNGINESARLIEIANSIVFSIVFSIFATYVMFVLAKKLFFFFKTRKKISKLNKLINDMNVIDVSYDKDGLPMVAAVCTNEKNKTRRYVLI